jgi:hypothetical protein
VVEGAILARVGLTAILFSLAVWIVAPDKLSHRAMRRIGSPEVPAWKWLAGILALFGYLGTTRRSLRA